MSQRISRWSRFWSRIAGSKQKPASWRRTRRLGIEGLEDRSMMSVDFLPGPLMAPAVNRTDQQLGTGFGAVVESVLAVNNTDPGNIAIASQNTIVISTNAGGSFSAKTGFVSPPGTVQFNGDSGLAFDAQGRLFWSTLKGLVADDPNTQQNEADADVAVSQVNPSGPNIGKPVSTNPLSSYFVFNDSDQADDKDFIAADANPLSPHANNLYVVWTKNSGGSGIYGVYVSRSLDQGKTWLTPPVRVSTDAEGTVWPSDITVAPNGDVYVAYHSQPNKTGDGNSDGASGATIVVRSTDGGEHFNQKTYAFTGGQSDITYNRQDISSGKISGETFWTIGSTQPWVLADPARPGNVYVIAADDPDNNHDLGDVSNIVISRSTNNGQTWTTSTVSAGTVVPGTPNLSFQLYPTAAIDRFGNIVVAWYDNRSGATNPAGHYYLDVMATYSTDGGLSWAPEFRLNDIPIDPDEDAPNRFNGPPATTWLGEYFGIDVFGGTAYVAWNGVQVNANSRQIVFDAFPINGTLKVDGDDGGVVTNDNIVVQQMAGNPDFIEVLVNGQRQYAGLQSALSGGIIIDGKGGNDVLTLNLDADNPAAITYNITMGLVTRPGLPSITYSNFDRVEVQTNNNNSTVANVIATHPNTVTIVDGAKTVNVGNGNLPDNIKGPLFIRSAAGQMNVTVNDSADGVFHTATLDSANFLGADYGFITGLSPAPIAYNYHDTSSLTLQTGTGGATVNVMATGMPPPQFIGQADSAALNLVGHASGIVNVGKNGSLNQITGEVTVSAPAGGAYITLNVDDSKDGAAHPAVVLDTVTMNGFPYGRISGLAPKDIEYRYADTSTVTVQTGTGGATVNVKATAKPVTLTGHADGTVNVGNAGSVQDVKGSLTITNPPAYTVINVDDSADPAVRNVTLESASASKWGKISGVLPGNAFVKYKYLDTEIVTVQTGIAVGNTVNVKSTVKPVKLIGHANSTVNVGNAGSVQDIKGKVTIHNPPAYTTLNVDDSADAVYRPNVVLDSVTHLYDLYGQISNLAPAAIEYQYSATALANVHTGSGGATVNVKSTRKPVNVIGHANGTVNVGNAGSVQEIQGDLTISDPPAYITLNIDDSADPLGRNVTLAKLDPAKSTIVGLAPGAINYVTADVATISLKTGTGGDTVNVQAMAKPFALNTLAGAAADVINLGDGSNGLSSITAPLTIQASNDDALNFNDQDFMDSRIYAVSDTSVTWLGGPTVSYTGLGGLVLNGSIGTDYFVLNGTSATAALTVTGGGGNNTVVSSKGHNIWSLPGTNTGSLFATAYQAPVSFTNVQNLIAGGTDDYFLFADGAGITGNLNGGGYGTLDYRNYSTSVVVDLQLPLEGTDTGVGGTVTGIRSVFGGTVTPAGPDVYNLLIGSGGNYLVGGTGRRNILVAGASPGTIVGGDGEDLIITGKMSYDTHVGLAEWYAIAAYWASADAFAVRMANLLAGSGVPLLDSTTVTGNGSGNVLSGAGGTLLLYNDGSDLAPGFASVIYVNIAP